MQSSGLRKTPARTQGGSENLFDMDTCCSDALSDMQMLGNYKLNHKEKKWLGCF
ncbi:MAG: hypothetical protein ABI723_18410 [Bacteroidia bacterium]